MRRNGLMAVGVAAAVVGAVLMSACESEAPAIAAPEPELPVLVGTFTLHVGPSVRASQPVLRDRSGDCWGTGGYSDFGSGMIVAVRDAAGTIIATGSTEQQRAVEQHADSERISLYVEEAEERTSGRSGWFCTVWFAVELPEADFYQVEVGRRGSLTYSRADLDAMGWAIALTLGP